MLNVYVGSGWAGAEIEVVHVFEDKSRNICGSRSADVSEIRAVHVIQNERRPKIVFHRANLDISHLDVLRVPNEKSVRRHRAEHTWLGIGVFFLRHLDVRGFFGAAALMKYVNIAQDHIFDLMAGDAADDRAESRGGIRTHDIADEHASQRAHLGAFGTAHAGAQPQKDRRAGDVAHGYVADGNVLEQRAVHGLKRQPLAAVEYAIGNGDVLESAVRFGAEFDAAGARHAEVGGEALDCRVEQRSFFVNCR